MSMFLIVFALLLLAAIGWIVISRRPARKTAAPAPARPSAIRAQTQPLDQPSHLNDRDFARLLRAAKGDRGLVESWILTERQRSPQLDRDGAIEKVAARLEASRMNG